MKRVFGKFKPVAFFLFLVFYINSYAQQQDSVANFNDTASLSSITVTSLSGSSKWKDVPAPVAVINQKQLQSLDNISLLPVLNMVAGVRMEERSPGSYRLSIRGSVLRSPFGVRNVKLYYNDIPLTDAGGNTYLNLIDISQVQNIEIIKGPSSSLYGANTGGVLLMQTNPYSSNKQTFTAGIEGGSYGLLKQQAKYNYSKNTFAINVQQAHLQSNGYRNNAAMHRDVFQTDVAWKINNSLQLSALLLYSNLFYKTPGGLNQAQMDSLPQLARSGTEAQHTGITNKTIFSGVNLTSEVSSSLSNKTSLVINHTDFNNPIIDKYEHRNELNAGLRTQFDFHKDITNSTFHFINGAEFLNNHSGVYTYGNNAGVKDSLQIHDNIYTQQYFFFSQFSITYNQRWELSAGISLNGQQLKYKRITDTANNNYTTQNIHLFPAPRVSVLYKVGSNVSIYGIISRGFSTPTLDEVRPSTDEFYNLQPEEGWNKEVGFKGSIINRFFFDASAYFFDLHHTIVENTDSSGANFFSNAGSTIQHGVELWFSGNIIQNKKSFINTLTITNSFAYQPYRFGSYIKNNTDYSHNRLTGVPKITDNISLNAILIKGFYINSNLNIVSSVPLNDANTVYAKGYQLFQLKAGWQKDLKKSHLNIFAGADNILNESYSLGNDLNAFGGRYFNPAAKRNYYAGAEYTF